MFVHKNIYIHKNSNKYRTNKLLNKLIRSLKYVSVKYLLGYIYKYVFDTRAIYPDLCMI